MIGWLADHIPPWVYLIILAGGGGAFFALVPGALALVTTVGGQIWRALPPWGRWLLIATVGAAIAWVTGRYYGAKGERDKNKVARETAVKNREEVDREVAKMDDSEVDKALREAGDFRDEEPRGPRRR